MATTLSETIRRDLSDRILSDLGPPAALSLPALSRHYGVSFTPVREALRDLIAEGVLLRRGNGRVGVNPRPRKGRRAAPGPADGPGPAEPLEKTVAREVIARSLRGDSGYLREEAAASRFGVGRTAIRQAFGRLAGQGLMEHVPRCGWRVRAFDAADLAAYLQVREAMELKALELARPHLDPAELRRMLAANADDGRPPHLDNALHRDLVAKAGNPYLRDFFDRHGAYYTTLFDYAAPETHVVEEMARQHRAILRALIARDWPRARRALARHIRAQRPVVEELLRRLGRSEHADLDSPTPTPPTPRKEDAAR